VSALIDELRAARAAESHSARLDDAADRAAERHQRADDIVQTLREQLAAAERNRDLAYTAMHDANQAAQSAAPAPDVAAIEQRMTDAEATNRAVRERGLRNNLARQLADAQHEQAMYGAKIDALDNRKAQAVRDAAMPIDGLAFDDTGVTYRGVPFKQASAAEQLRVSLAMAMALNPKIRVIRITDGSLLDSANMQLIADMAAGRGFQVWVERVDESGAVGVVIEDGAVAQPVKP
jgi:hypothetical protein